MDICFENENGYNIAGYKSFFCSTKDESGKKGYAGVVLYTKLEPIAVLNGLGKRTWSNDSPNDLKHVQGTEAYDLEGRVITAEFEDFYFVGTCAMTLWKFVDVVFWNLTVLIEDVPNSSRGLVRLEYRRKWNRDFLEFLLKLNAKKPVLLGGDMNVAHLEIGSLVLEFIVFPNLCISLDLANPKTNRKNAGFTDEERADFTKLLDAGFVDVFRQKHPDTRGAYTFWTHMGNCRQRNVGWWPQIRMFYFRWVQGCFFRRLDYFLVSERFMDNVKSVKIQKDVMGSDHCPISLIVWFVAFLYFSILILLKCSFYKFLQFC